MNLWQKKLQLIEMLITRGSTAGERTAAKNAYARIKTRYAKPGVFSEWMNCPSCKTIGWHDTFIIFNSVWVKCCNCKKTRGPK